MKPEQWGPPVWRFFHTLAEKIKDPAFPIIGKHLFGYIHRIAGYLPCPDCSKHAKLFLAKINISDLKTKQDLINIMYIFHNAVNKRKSKQMFHVEQLPRYKNNSLLNSYNHFISVYHTKGNMTLLTETFQRDLLVKEFKKWLAEHIHYFDK